MKQNMNPSGHEENDRMGSMFHFIIFVMRIIVV